MNQNPFSIWTNKIAVKIVKKPKFWQFWEPCRLSRIYVFIRSYEIEVALFDDGCLVNDSGVYYIN